MILEELLQMDGHSAIDWLVENKMDFELVNKEMVINLLSDCHAPALDVRDWKLVDRINDAIIKLE